MGKEGREKGGEQREGVEREKGGLERGMGAGGVLQNITDFLNLCFYK